MQISIEKEVWATSKLNTKKFTHAFHNSELVVLIFSLNESRHFQGFAEMLSLPSSSYQKNVFNSGAAGCESAPAERQFQNNFKVRWLK